MRTFIYEWINTGLRVAWRLKISSSVADCSFVSFSFFLLPLLLVLLSGLSNSFECFKQNNPFALSSSSWSCWIWSTSMGSSPLGQSWNVRSKEGTLCFTFFGTWCPPIIPSPRLRLVMHVSSSSMAEELVNEWMNLDTN